MPKEDRRGMAYFKNNRNLKASIVDIKGARFLSNNHGKTLKRIRTPSTNLSGPSLPATTRSPKLHPPTSSNSTSTPISSKKFSPIQKLIFSSRTKIKRFQLRSQLKLKKETPKVKICSLSKLKTLKRNRADSGGSRALTNYNRRVSSKFSTIGPKKKKMDLEPCSFYTRFGECKRSFCKFSHKKINVFICPRDFMFLKAKTCDKDGCKLSHNFDVGKLPPCRFFKQGGCVNDDCPYLHVNSSAKVNTKTINNSKGKPILKSKFVRLKENAVSKKPITNSSEKTNVKNLNIEKEVKTSRYYAPEPMEENSPKLIEIKLVEPPIVKPTVIEERRTRLLNKLTSLKQRAASNSEIQPASSERYSGKPSTSNMPDFMPL